MSHGKLRIDKTCLNCGHTVEERFCTHCGQENIETRQPFYYLFTHFIEDFTHYDGQFWKTIKNLLFRPGYLTKIYLEGKRQLYVPPVKLYIFISFITFFFSAVLPSDNFNETSNPSTNKEQKDTQRNTNKIHEIKKENYITKDKSLQVVESIPLGSLDSTKAIISTNATSIRLHNIQTIEDYDKKYSGLAADLGRPFVKKILKLEKEGVPASVINEKFSDTFMHTLPKALFIYLPIFTLFLWLFHDKKKWYYSDHGIFTLHYFSFLLTTVVCIMLFDTVEDFLNNTIVSAIFGLFCLATIIYWIIYFIKAHKNLYQTKKATSILKGAGLFIVNFIALSFLLIGLVAYSFLTLH